MNINEMVVCAFVGCFSALVVYGVVSRLCIVVLSWVFSARDVTLWECLRAEIGRASND
jgi:hypothetical protein